MCSDDRVRDLLIETALQEELRRAGSERRLRVLVSCASAQNDHAQLGPALDQQPRPGLAGMICFLHPKATRGVLVEYAQPQ